MPLSENYPSNRAPRLRVLANGQYLIGAYGAEIRSNDHFSADCFVAVLALGADSWANASFWSSEANVHIDIQISLNGGSDFTSLIQGLVDAVSLDHVNGVLRVSGRDFTAALIEAKTQETFSNRTSSEIATIFAGRHGLSACVTPTNTPIGRFYENDYESLTLSRFSNSTTEWDFLVSLARLENYEVFVSGRDLCFQPLSQPCATTRIMRPTDMTELRLERALTLARGIQVTVQSWNSLRQMSFSEKVERTTAANSLADGNGTTTSAQQYVLIHPNLTPDKAAAIAQQRLSELSRHERTIEFSMPGELELAPRDALQLDGTETDFDQVYYVASVERVFRLRTGFTQNVRASNSSPSTDVASGSAV